MSRKSKRLLAILATVAISAGAAGIVKSAYQCSYLPFNDVVTLVSLDSPKC